ncbi:toprim domain-containing protein [Candidatus Neomarinimicrobiota bacterium]
MKYKYYGVEAERYHQYLLNNYSHLPIPELWSKKVIIELDIGWCYKKKCFTFPHYDKDGLIINVHFHKGFSIGDGSCKWYPVHFVARYDTSKPLFITEGEKDCVSYLSKNKQALCSTLGALNIPQDLSPLEPFKEIIILYDNDEAGINGALKLAESIKSTYPNKIVKVVKW